MNSLLRDEVLASHPIADIQKVFKQAGLDLRRIQALRS